MKTVILLLLSGLLVSQGYAQTCCTPPEETTNHTQFATNASDANFRGMHETPRKVTLNAAGGEMVSFKTADGKTGNVYLVKSPNKSNRYLIMIHEWWGLNDNIKSEAQVWREKLGEVNVFAVDLYDGNVTTSPEEAGKAMQALKSERAIAILTGAMEYAGKNAEFATIGWCMGGGWSHKANLIGGPQVKACAIYYGQPDANVEGLKMMQSAPVIFIWPKQDQWINEAMVTGFQKAMNEAGKSITVKAYDADHAFANPSSPRYVQEAATQANAEVLLFFKQHFVK
jgi:carboxymethylenebutenolidase